MTSPAGPSGRQLDRAFGFRCRGTVALMGAVLSRSIRSFCFRSHPNTSAIFWQWASAHVQFVLLVVSLGAILIAAARRIVRLVQHRSDPIAA